VNAIPENIRRIPTLYYVGPLLLFIAAAANGILEVHPENDTWIGLAAGRQILTLNAVPLTDSFSFTVAGKPWYNQNWLTHVIQYWLYDRVSHDAVIYANWIFGLGIFGFVGLAAYWRTRSCAGALIAASITAFGCRNFLSARPATVGFFCLAALLAMLCALEGQGARRRWAPIVALLPLFLFWGNAHGSFIFGYGVLGIYVLHWVLLRLCSRQSPLTSSQVIVITLIMITAVGLTIWFGPFGVQNFTHGEKVAASSIWRDVAEWQPPYSETSKFPPVARFWWILAAAGIGVAIAAAPRARNAAAKHNSFIHMTLFDVGLVIIGVAMALWARRFAPIFFMVLPPLLLIVLIRATERISDAWKFLSTKVLYALTGLLGIALGVGTGIKAYADLVTDYEPFPQFGLLERVTVYDIVPQDAFNFINENKLELHLLAEWSLAGSVMLHSPGAKVFIDGRAQQVYEETHYREYQTLFVATDTPEAVVARILDQSGTDSILLLKNWIHGTNLWSMLEHSTDWTPVLVTPDYRLYLRRGSPALGQLGDRLKTEIAWWPGELSRLIGSGFVWSGLGQPETAHAIDAWKSALSRNLGAGVVCLKPLTKSLLDLGRREEAAQFLAAYRRRIAAAADLSPETKDQLERVIADAESMVGD
jgi:hypothetical protein